VIAAETKVDTSRFAGKPVYVTSTKHAMRAGQEVIRTALAEPARGAPHAGAAGAAGAVTEGMPAEQPKARSGPYKHLMTGVSYMLPVVIAGGLAIALAFAVGGIYAGKQQGTLAWALDQIGGGTAFQLFVAVLSGFIAYSIADRPGIAPGLVGGMLAQNLGAGFLGGIVSGFLAGYLTKLLADRIRLPATLEGLKPVLILPFLSTISVGLLMIYVVAPPVQTLNHAMNTWLLNMRGTNAALLGVVLGSMMAVDVGGPVNKAAYTFAVGLLGSSIQTPMAAVMAAGMTPPLGLALAAFLFRDRFDAEERKAGGPALVLGLSFISEGAIPFAAKDPLRVIPALVLGSGVTGALSMLVGARLRVPHGGVFAALIPGAVTHLAAYLGAIAAGTVVTAGALFVLKRPLPTPRA
jgi:fructose PTS system EIIBC or EIIC component